MSIGITVTLNVDHFKNDMIDFIAAGILAFFSIIFMYRNFIKFLSKQNKTDTTDRNILIVFWSIVIISTGLLLGFAVNDGGEHILEKIITAILISILSLFRIYVNMINNYKKG